jgi:hypothetical protein
MKMHFIIVSIVSFLLTACSTSSLEYKDEHIMIQTNDITLNVEGTVIQQKQDTFSGLRLSQTLLKLQNGDVIAYEYANIGLNYRFESLPIRSLRILFDAKRMIKVYHKGALYAYQVQLKDNRLINVVVIQKYDQEFKMLYGMSTQKLNTLLKHLDATSKQAYYKDVFILKESENPFLTHWTVKNVQLTPLVYKIHRLIRL